MSSGEEMYELLKRRDAELVALRRYVEALEEALAQKRDEEASDKAREAAYREIAALRYEYGFKVGSGVPWR